MTCFCEHLRMCVQFVREVQLDVASRYRSKCREARLSEVLAWTGEERTRSCRRRLAWDWLQVWAARTEAYSWTLGPRLPSTMSRTVGSVAIAHIQFSDGGRTWSADIMTSQKFTWETVVWSAMAYIGDSDGEGTWKRRYHSVKTKSTCMTVESFAVAHSQVCDGGRTYKYWNFLIESRSATPIIDRLPKPKVDSLTKPQPTSAGTIPSKHVEAIENRGTSFHATSNLLMKWEPASVGTIISKRDPRHRLLDPRLTPKTRSITPASDQSLILISLTNCEIREQMWSASQTLRSKTDHLHQLWSFSPTVTNFSICDQSLQVWSFSPNVISLSICDLFRFPNFKGRTCKCRQLLNGRAVGIVWEMSLRERISGSSLQCVRVRAYVLLCVCTASTIFTSVW